MTKKILQLNVILYEPEIHGNVGAIMRTCVALNAKLHLIEPFGFFFDKRILKRSSVNYINNLDYQIYDDWQHFCEVNKTAKIIWCTTSHTSQIYWDVDYTSCNENIWVMFGKESTGIAKNILNKYQKTCIRIPMANDTRSLNLAISAGIVLYEIAKQQKIF